jgi:ABC-type spermidine/putrescine transport system permease subunit I
MFEWLDQTLNIRVTFSNYAWLLSDDLYIQAYWNSIKIAFNATVFCLLLGYPMAYAIAKAPSRLQTTWLLLVLLPSWTSFLIRVYAWMGLLGNNGVFNNFMIWIGLIDSPIQMLNTNFAVYIGVVYSYLPFMVLPLYSVMKTIPPSYVRAAKSLGATPWTAFWRVYVPQTLPGIGAGAVLVFIISIGYYITPALVGGQSGQMISNLIAYHMQTSLNWGLAAALGSVLLISVLILYWVYNRLVGADSLKLG